MTSWMGRAGAFAIVAWGLAPPVCAQTSGAAPARRSIAEISAGIAADRPKIEFVSCCDLRTPPSLSTQEQRFRVWSLDVHGRVYWSPRLSAGAEIQWDRPARATFTYVAPATPPSTAPPFTPTAPIERTAERAGWRIAFLQAVDLAARGRWRPWLGGGLLIERSAYVFTETEVAYQDGTTRQLPPDRYAWHVSRRALVATAGLKVDLGSGVFASAGVLTPWYLSNATDNQYLDDPMPRDGAVIWQAGAGVRWTSRR